MSGHRVAELEVLALRRLVAYDFMNVDDLSPSLSLVRHIHLEIMFIDQPT